MPELGHVVLYVRELPRSLSFYRAVVGLNVVGEIFNRRAAMLSGGRTHHELLLIEVGAALELYIDDPNVDWRQRHDWMQQPVKPLRL